VLAKRHVCFAHISSVLRISKDEYEPFYAADGFLLNQAIKCLEAHLTTAIMAEKRQELSQRT
jgi:hypothetical protein